jgi:16S rRNA processing protein RimM
LNSAVVTEICLARIVRPQGRRGEVRAEVLTDFPERLLKLRRALLGGRGAPRPVAVLSCRLEPSRRFAVFHFEGSQSIDDAERLVGLEVQVPIDQRLPLPQGSYYISDLAGCEVFEAGADVALGRVRDVQRIGEETAGTPILIVDMARGGELLVPLAADICQDIDTARRRIVVTLPEGLLELNPE